MSRAVPLALLMSVGSASSSAQSLRKLPSWRGGWVTSDEKLCVVLEVDFYLKVQLGDLCMSRVVGTRERPASVDLWIPGLCERR